MRINHQPILTEKPSISSRLSHFSVVTRQPVPISEGKIQIRKSNFIPWLKILSDDLKYKKVCYFTNWSQYRTPPAKFQPEYIDPFLCTHIVYAFAYIHNRTLSIIKIEENDEGLNKINIFQ